MALSGIGGALSGIGLPSLQPRPTRENEERQPVAADPKAVPQPAKQTAADAVMSAEPPPGTDPAFWSVLTTEERQFFSKMQSLGPLTYGPRSAAPKAPLPRGGRIDLKV
jgi:hypothetical protein